ncbi:hypothetical protein K6V90_09325 [Cupriavidus pauculus]|uniref:hypothetical protein n=1 Tax=Cupriavidus pauculus TaxID=82633 RepID=UPI001C93208F|nr:hypothetical protein [Cupriavidus pauculus]MBY4730731.1 hypothetical protein [Cupriavidus pauculus]
MTALLAILAKIWPYLLAAGGVIFGMLRHKQAQTAEAKAQSKVADADAKVANTEKSEAEANANAARAGADAIRERTNVENDITAGAPGESAKRLRDEWSRD